MPRMARTRVGWAQGCARGLAVGARAAGARAQSAAVRGQRRARAGAAVAARLRPVSTSSSSSSSRELCGISTCEAGNCELRNSSARAPARQRASAPARHTEEAMQHCAAHCAHRHSGRIHAGSGGEPAPLAGDARLSPRACRAQRTGGSGGRIAAAAPIPGIPAAAEFRALQLRLDPRSFAHTALCAPRLAARGMSGVCSCE